MTTSPSIHASRECTISAHGPGEEHVFYAHPDPRWLVCDCGQFAQRMRTPDGQPAVRLIDEPARTPRLHPLSKALVVTSGSPPTT